MQSQTAGERQENLALIEEASELDRKLATWHARRAKVAPKRSPWRRVIVVVLGAIAGWIAFEGAIRIPQAKTEWIPDHRRDWSR